MKKIIVEVPKNDFTSGGINRMIRLVFELPKYSSTSGGVGETIKLSNKFLIQPMIRFQRLEGEYPQIPNKWTVGLPDSTFPPCDVCITYSDNPYLESLVALPQVKKTLIYMLSYGMAIERERKNVLNKNVTVMCSTKKLEKLILDEGVNVHRVGFGLDMEEMFDENLPRKNYLAIMYHPSKDKKYETAVFVGDYLFNENFIDGVITFGNDVDYKRFTHPKGLIKHYSKANRSEIREIFNMCKCFLMPSISEGLNLTPVESVLCGCPAILCDGAIGELFIGNENCFITKHEDRDLMKNLVRHIMINFDKYSTPFRLNMNNIVKQYSWENTVKNINKLIY